MFRIGASFQAKQPCLQDGLRLEVFSYRLLHRLHTHLAVIIRLSLQIYTIFLKQANKTGGKLWGWGRNTEISLHRREGDAGLCCG